MRILARVWYRTGLQTLLYDAETHTFWMHLMNRSSDYSVQVPEDAARRYHKAMTA